MRQKNRKKTKEKKKGKRRNEQYYALNPYLCLLLFLVNKAWVAWRTKGALCEADPLTFDKSDYKLDNLLNLVLCRKDSPILRTLLEIKLYLSFYAFNFEHDLSKNPKVRDLINFLYERHTNLTINWWEKMRGVPFCISDSGKLEPYIDPNRPIDSLWSLTAFFMANTERDRSRLGLCKSFHKEGEYCMNLFWIMARNRNRAYCDDIECKKTQNRKKMRDWRKKKRSRKNSNFTYTVTNSSMAS